MIRFLFVALLLLTGCGGSPKAAPTAQAVGASFTDPKLAALWQGAQTTIATQPIELNAALVVEDKEYPSYVPADSRAYGVEPTGVTVTVEPDLTAAQLQAAGFPKTVAEPTGVIQCPQNAGNVKWCHSYTIGNDIVVAQSLLYSAGATQYEMENVILQRLGYNIGGR
jgi:hypothetical protein